MFVVHMVCLGCASVPSPKFELLPHHLSPSMPSKFAFTHSPCHTQSSSINQHKTTKLPSGMIRPWVVFD